MRYCLGYEYKERVVDATGFQMGQSGTDLVQTHAVPIEASQAAATTACGMDYGRVDANLNWFDPHSYPDAYPDRDTQSNRNTSAQANCNADPQTWY